jgi:hypothetical protein
MNILNQVAKYHNDWVELAAVFDKDWAEDIVQEMYLLLHKVQRNRTTNVYQWQTKSWICIYNN